VVGSLLAFQALPSSLAAQEASGAAPSSNIPISRLPDPIRAPKVAGGHSVRKATFTDESSEVQELNWRRRDIAQTNASGLKLSQAGVRVATRQDPLNDPFGDRPQPPAPAAKLAPASAPQLQPVFGNAAYSTRRSTQDVTALGESPVSCEVLTGSSIDSITFSLAPPLFPGRDEEKRQQFLTLLPKLIGNPVVTWTTYSDTTLTSKLSYEGKFDRIRTDTRTQRLIVEIVTPDGNVLALGEEGGPITNETFQMARISTYNKQQDWMDKQGHVLANGWFLDYLNDTIIVRTAEGEDVSIRHGDLNTASLEVVSQLWELPQECVVPAVGSTQRDWVAQTYTWKASALCHKPLFFEDIQLERYGHSAGPLVQPFRSGAHFFMNIAALPYNVGVYPPTECRYALGYYRPGNCAPFRGYAFPLSKRGALSATGFYIAAPVILP
jgi:hypothetical protein